MLPNTIWLLTLTVKHEGMRVLRACSCPKMLREAMEQKMATENAAALERQDSEVAATFDDLKEWSEQYGMWDGDEAEMIKLSQDWWKDNMIRDAHTPDGKTIAWTRSDHTWEIRPMDLEHPESKRAAPIPGLGKLNEWRYDESDLCGGQMPGLS